jgi:hypothetical protein
MKKLFAFLIGLIFISSCSTTKEANSSNSELRSEKKLAEQVVIKKAVESRRFIIKLDRLYLHYGGTVDLFPRANYIIIDGDKAIISAAYLGRQFDVRPIEGIDMRGETINYELISQVSRGMYEIKTTVTNGANSFNLSLSIGKNGSCNASLSGIRIENVSYKGNIVPLKDKVFVPLEKGNEI